MWALCLVCSSSCQKASAFLSQSSISPLLFSTGWKGSLLPRQRCHHKYNVGFTKWHSLGPPKLSIFLAPMWCQVSKEVQQMTFSLVPCHVSSPGPRWFYLIPESSIVTPDCPSALPLTSPSLPSWVGPTARRVLPSPLSKNPVLPEIQVAEFLQAVSFPVPHLCF